MLSRKARIQGCTIEVTDLALLFPKCKTTSSDSKLMFLALPRYKDKKTEKLEGELLMRCWFLPIMFFVCFMVGCSYKTPVDPVYGVNTYSTYASKIPGKYALIIKANPNILDVDAHPSSAVGADAKFQISFSGSFATSVRMLNETIFSNIINTDTIPSVEQMKQDKFSGYILISSKFFEPDTKSISGMFNTGVSATANIGFDYTIRNSDNEILLAGSVSSSRTTTAQGGALGTTANDNIKALQDAIQKALRDNLEQYAQRVANDQKLRDIK